MSILTLTLWASNGSPDDTTLVICESPLDCLSYHQLFPDDTTRYFATGGTLSDKQKTLLKGVFDKFHNKGGHIMIATDKDEAGNGSPSRIKISAWLLPAQYREASLQESSADGKCPITARTSCS